MHSSGVLGKGAEGDFRGRVAVGFRGLSSTVPVFKPAEPGAGQQAPFGEQAVDLVPVAGFMVLMAELGKRSLDSTVSLS